MHVRTKAQTLASVTRFLDVTIAALALLLLLPLFALISLAVLIESGRPIFFRQTRLGLAGKHFDIIKFRKFATKSPRLGLPLTMKMDKRMSRVGHFLARTKLDELPQLLNVLRGEMAIVGPRPESLDFADCFEKEYDGVLMYRPGILGPSQAAFRDECSLYPENTDPTLFYRQVLFPMKARVDLAYYAERTLASDVKWMIFGALAVFGVAFHPVVDQAEVQPHRLSSMAASPDVLPLKARARRSRRVLPIARLVFTNTVPKQKAN